ncbi:MAG: hypothetical protein H0W06_12275, partial [Chloroflexia bacterium]|nr:hypothetical protein [Chloroflexia bacterium]
MLVVVGALLAAGVALGVWARRAQASGYEPATALRRVGGDLVRLPGRLRRVAADPRTPRRARWALIALALYIA